MLDQVRGEVLEDVEQRVSTSLAEYSERVEDSSIEDELQEIVREKLTAREEWDATGLREQERESSEAGNGEKEPETDVAPLEGEDGEKEAGSDDELRGEIDLF